MAIEQSNLMRSEMTPVLQNTNMMTGADSAAEDIPINDINGTVNVGRGNFNSPETFPQILPNNPTFSVPSNPLLPEEYREILDYNSLQYLNGLLRTQIGMYVRVEQLVGSNIIQDYDGFLIGVGINYIILQEYSNANIRILDIYGIKNVYVYYADVENPFIRE